MGVIGITGANGLLGRYLTQLEGCVPIQADVTDEIELSAALRQVRPQAVIHCAAYTDVDGAEDAPIDALKTNLYGTALLAHRFKGRLIVLSTDYIFDGQDGPYDEAATPNPLGVYGMSKLAAEMAVAGRPDTLIVRTTILFGWHPAKPNFVTTVLGKLENHQPVALPDSIYGTPTYARDLSHALRFLASLVSHPTGVIHVVGPNLLSRLQFGKLIATTFGFSPELITPGRISGRAKRPRKAGLQTVRLNQLRFTMSSTVTALEHMKEDRQNHAI